MNDLKPLIAPAVVYKAENLNADATGLPATARSKFAEEWGVPYNDTWAKLRRDSYAKEGYVVVGLINEEDAIETLTEAGTMFEEWKAAAQRHYAGEDEGFK